MSDYLKQSYNIKETPQSQKIPGSNQVPNSAGGYSFAIDDWKRLNRFLILGSTLGTYYISEQKLTVENAEAVRRCINENGKRVVDIVVDISDSGKAPKNDPALFVLAMCASFGDKETKVYALDNLPKVARIGTHLFHFIDYVEGFRGWGRGLRKAVAKWYLNRTPESLAFQATKYQSRDGWSHSDLIRLSHLKTNDAVFNNIIRWIIKNPECDIQKFSDNKAYNWIVAYNKAQVAKEEELVQLINQYNLPMEFIPTKMRTKKVYEALLPNLGLTALIRNLGTLSKNEIIAKGRFDTLKYVTETITNQDALQKARVHPIQILSALVTYSQGKGFRGSNTWNVVPDVVDALNNAFHLAFQNVIPTNKRYVLALDVSGSMASYLISGVPGLTPRVGAAAMAMITYAVEKNVAVIAFQDKIVQLDISRQKRLDDVVRATNDLPFGKTDCAQPMLWAIDNNVLADVFIIYTDSETWVGRIHPIQALNAYRRKFNIPAKLIVVGMTSNGFTIASPEDLGMLDIVGFDTSTSLVMNQFVLE